MASSHLSVLQLEEKFGKDHFVKVEEGEGKLPKVVLRSKSGARLEVYLNGGHISSFKRADGEELIFMSSKAVFQQGKAIRGGVPICWPQFGPGELVQHGFARTSQWAIQESHVINGGETVSVTLLLEDSEETRKLWPHSFAVELVITVDGEKLVVELRVHNRNQDKPFQFTTALHTYFKIKSIHSTFLQGLQGTTYVDKVLGGKKEEEKSGDLKLHSETDRVYLQVPGDVKVTDAQKGTIVLKRNNLPDCVVWNLWAEKAKAMADMGDDDWLEFVCAEAGAIGSAVTVEPGKTWIGTQEILKL